MPLGARSKFMLLHYVGSQRAAKLAARGAELEPAPQSPSIFRELVQKGSRQRLQQNCCVYQRCRMRPNFPSQWAHPLVAPRPPAAAAIKAVGGAIFKIQLILNHPSPARRQCNLIRLSATLINGDKRALDMFTCAKDLFFGPQSFLGRFPRRIE